jgi:hypothetical protein
VPPVVRTSTMRFRLRTIFVLTAIAAVYFASYFFLSRLGFEQSDDLGVAGVYFVVPDTPLRAVANRFCVVIYFPMIVLDCEVGQGRWPASHDEVFRGP